MSKRLELRQHLAILGDISGIMTAMKNLSLIETRKLARFLANQQRALAGIESAVGDFLSFYPQPGNVAEERCVYLAIGSERGFCGEFNEEITAALQACGETHRLVVVGRKLTAKLTDDPRVAATVEGPTVAEEVQAVLLRLMEALHGLGDDVPQHNSLKVLHHQDEQVVVRPLLPMPIQEFPAQRHSDPPLLNLPSAALYAELVDHYLFAALHQAFYASLMAENRYRLQHMERALQRMEQESSDLTLKYNVLRQEEIIEEIEIIMLSAETLAER
ncbi:MAG: F0F1 ATP synthase subunit gamma [Sulfuricella sp.]|nr:F0F1 ATP synthase subunit gamma [Sulfuricella sp.]